MARRRFLVAYDISDPDRLRRVHKTMKGFGHPFQYSVFLCDLDAMELIDLKFELGGVIDHRADRIAIVDLGELTAGPERRFQFMGRESPTPVRGPQVF